jgi:hypothetical protein
MKHCDMLLDSEFKDTFLRALEEHGIDHMEGPEGSQDAIGSFYESLINGKVYAGGKVEERADPLEACKMFLDNFLNHIGDKKLIVWRQSPQLVDLGFFSNKPHRYYTSCQMTTY